MTMMVNLLLGVAMIFIVMAALFESTLYPISIITSIVFSIVGVLLVLLRHAHDLHVHGDGRAS